MLRVQKALNWNKLLEFGHNYVITILFHTYFSAKKYCLPPSVGTKFRDYFAEHICSFLTEAKEKNRQPGATASTNGLTQKFKHVLHSEQNQKTAPSLAEQRDTNCIFSPLSLFRRLV